MAAQVDLHGGREPAEPEVGVGHLLTDHETGVGKARLACDRRHPLVRGRLVEHDYGRGAAGERPLGERVYRSQPHLIATKLVAR